MGVSELEKLFEHTESYCLNKLMHSVSHTLSDAYFTYDVFPSFKTKIVTIDPILGSAIEVIEEEESIALGPQSHRQREFHTEGEDEEHLLDQSWK